MKTVLKLTCLAALLSLSTSATAEVRIHDTSSSTHFSDALPEIKSDLIVNTKKSSYEIRATRQKKRGLQSYKQVDLNGSAIFVCAEYADNICSAISIPYFNVDYNSCYSSFFSHCLEELRGVNQPAPGDG